MKFEQLTDLFFDLKQESNNFRNFKPNLFLENPEYLYLFRYLLGKTREEYANIFSLVTYEKLNEVIKKKKIDNQQAEKYQEIIGIYLDELDKNKTLITSMYLEEIINNFLKEKDKDKLIFEVKMDKVVSSTFYKFTLLILLGFSYFGFILGISPVNPFNKEPIVIFIISFTIFILMIFLRKKYNLRLFETRLLYISYIIQHFLDKDSKLIYFVKDYLFYISSNIKFNRYIEQIKPILDEISDIFSDITKFLKNKLIYQLDKENFTEVSLILKNIGLQKTEGCLNNYIDLKKYIKDSDLKFENMPYKKPSKYNVTIIYTNILIKNLMGLSNIIKSILFEIFPYLTIATVISYGYYQFTGDLNNSTLVFTAVCGLLAIAYNKRK